MQTMLLASMGSVSLSFYYVLAELKDLKMLVA
jgi:hypothetical protein